MAAEASRVVALERPRRTVEAGDGLVAGGGRLPTAFHSILFATAADRVPEETVAVPEFFADLNCDQIVDAITLGREEFDLKPFFYASLRRVDAINYRQEVMRDLEKPSIMQCVRSFTQRMREMREHIGRRQKSYYKEQREAWHLSAIETYCRAIEQFVADLADAKVESRGFRGFRDFLTAYARSDRFLTLVADTEQRKAELATVRYCVLIKGDKFTVQKYEEEIDYSADVENTFAKFKQGAVKDYAVKFRETEDMNHIEGKILEFVAKLFPNVFVPLDAYCEKYAIYVDETVGNFDREIHFYLSYFDYMAVLKQANLSFCYPLVSDRTKEVFDRDGFDLALAHKLVRDKSPVVCNDFELRGNERILVVSGPNQGGKTTFARTFGQLHYLASIGCPVPGRQAQLFLFDRLFTHFEKEERVENLRGKLEDDLMRIHQILSAATSRSIVIMNEIFTSTTIQDETFLSKKVMEKISELDLLCVWVTFVDELASYGPQTVSMMSTVVAENPALRTFKVVRRPADGLAYAMAIAQKYRLTYAAIGERLRS
jgi:DNA mismatch repair protein MutS